MVIRAWTEAERHDGFRARLTFAADPTAEPSVLVVTDREKALDAVRTWLFALPG